MVPARDESKRPAMSRTDQVRAHPASRRVTQTATMQSAPAPAAACPTCRFDEIRRYILAGRHAESRGCWHHIVTFPAARQCERYEREPGSDD